MSQRTYTNQFTVNDTDHKLHVPQFLLQAPWQDVSWGNDAAPRFENHDRFLAVWVDYDDPANREYDDWKKYTVVELLSTPDEGVYALADDELFSTEDEAELLMFLTEQTGPATTLQDIDKLHRDIVSMIDYLWGPEAESYESDFYPAYNPETDWRAMSQEESDAYLEKFIDFAAADEDEGHGIFPTMARLMKHHGITVKDLNFGK